MKSSQCQLGYSLFAILVSLAIVSPLLMAALGTVRTASHRLKIEREHRDQLEIASTVDFYSQQAMEALDEHRLSLPRIHPPGVITFFDGSPLRLSFRPESQSNALTRLSLDTKSALWVMARDVANSTITACLRFPTIASPFSSRSVLALSTAGPFELIVRETRPTSDRCYRFTLRPSQSVLSPRAPDEILQFSSILFPIREISTLYLTETKELRHLTHVGDQLIENQPLGKGPRVLSFKMQRNHFGVSALITDLSFENRLFSFINFHHLWSFPPENILGNRRSL